ncbi:hypothetical protein WJX77_007302 [Trebouxia sp. C0004]
MSHAQQSTFAETQTAVPPTTSRWYFPALAAAGDVAAAKAGKAPSAYIWIEDISMGGALAAADAVQLVVHWTALYHQHC